MIFLGRKPQTTMIPIMGLFLYGMKISPMKSFRDCVFIGEQCGWDQLVGVVLPSERLVLLRHLNRDTSTQNNRKIQVSNLENNDGT